MKSAAFSCAPVLVIGFNRPTFVREQFKALSQAKPAKVFFAVDGPRADRPEEKDLCNQTARAIEEIDWDCQVQTLCQPSNLGCKYAPPAAISWFFSHVEAGIVLEDDCRPTMDFLRFATELLERYRDDNRIGMISGNNHYGFITDKNASYRFSCDVSIWGWATWRRVWQLYDVEPAHYANEIDELLATVSLTGRGRRLRKLFFETVLSSNGTWDTQFALTLARHKLLAICPRENLVANLGFCPESTHTAGFSYDKDRYVATMPMAFPLRHPSVVARDVLADRLHELRSFALLPRILTELGRRNAIARSNLVPQAQRIERVFPSLFRL